MLSKGPNPSFDIQKIYVMESVKIEELKKTDQIFAY